MLLFHGTTHKNWESARRTGLNSPCLTDDLSIARYYAETTAEEDKGIACILVVSVSSKTLKYDHAAMAEPIALAGQCSKALAQKATRAIALAKKLNYRVSLKTVNSCRHMGTVPPDRISILKKLVHG